MNALKILIIGAGGYIGTALISELIKEGYNVRCFDRFSSSKIFFKLKANLKADFIKGDIRNVDSSIFNGIDIVIDLAALTKNLTTKNESEIFDVNKTGRDRIIKLAKQNGITRYLRISSSNVYGGNLNKVDEKFIPNPIDSYAKANLLVDKEALLLNDDKFSVTVLRLASIYGNSPRMRWDQSINNLIFNLLSKNKIVINSKNSKRPFLHIKDAIRAIILIIKSENEKVAGEIFNVGSDEQNYTMEQVAEMIIQAVGGKCELILQDEKDDYSFTMSCKKIKEKLGFEVKFGIDYGVKEIINALKQG